MKWFIGIITVGAVIVFMAYIKRKQNEVKTSVQKRVAGKNIQLIDEYALYVAKQSDGYSHFRAVGCLVLTEDELYFERQFDRKKIVIPIGSILKVERTRRLGGQSIAKMMLKVIYKTQYDKQDAIAWKVKDLEQWINAISTLLRDVA